MANLVQTSSLFIESKQKHLKRKAYLFFSHFNCLANKDKVAVVLSIYALFRHTFWYHMRDKKEEPHLFINIQNISFCSCGNCRRRIIKASQDILSQQIWLGKCKLNICDGFEGFTTQDTILMF